MATCMAPPWPSQRRSGFNSERHTALARMRERRAGRDIEECHQLPKAPVSARTPRSELPAVPSPPIKSSREPETRPPSMADERAFKSERYMPSRGLFAQTLRADRHFLQEEEPRSRVRGPAEARAARERPSSSNADKPKDEALPKEAKGADFRTLHEMIAKGIIESETGFSKMEATLRADDTEEEDLQRHRELVRRHRAEAEEVRQREREQARVKRQKEWDEQQRRIQLEMEREDEDEAQPMPPKLQPDDALLQRCKMELKAASRIQAVFRGHRSRRGHPTDTPAIHAVLHVKPFIKPEVLELE